MKNLTTQRSIAFGTLAVFSATILGGFVAPQSVQADSKTWKKVAIGAGAVTAYGLLKGKGKVATIGGIATAGSYLKYRSDKKKEDRRRANRRSSRYYRRR